jgi:hypothetical protein
VTTRKVTRWISPDNGEHGETTIELIHLIGTGGANAATNRDAHLMAGGDGWHLQVKHPASGVVISSTWLALDHPNPARAKEAEASLAAALKAVNAVPVIKTARSAK